MTMREEPPPMDWKRKYADDFIRLELTRAAKAAGAYNPQQVFNALAPTADVVETVDADGRPACEVRVQVTTLGKTLEAPPPLALELMKGDPENANLFTENLPPGMGPPKPVHEMDTHEYMQSRRKARPARGNV
jgi:hypothetical protein